MKNLKKLLYQELKEERSVLHACAFYFESFDKYILCQVDGLKHKGEVKIKPSTSEGKYNIYLLTDNGITFHKKISDVELNNIVDTIYKEVEYTDNYVEDIRRLYNLD